MSKPKKPRECQPCTACCDGWLQGVIGGIPIYPGHGCPDSSDKCENYENRQQDPCRSFNCAWIVEGSKLPEWMKPDNSKAIVVLNKWKWNGHPVDLAVPVGRRIPPRTLKLLMEYAEKNQRLLIYSEQVMENGEYTKQQNFTGYGPPAFQEDMIKWREDGRVFKGL